MPSPSLLLMVAGLLFLLVLRPRMRSPSPEGWGWLQGPTFPLLVGLCTAGLTTWIWGGLAAVPVLHDEVAYVLQAELLATGRLAAPSPPVPEAFTQAAVLVTPVMAPKMLPGHAAVLVPGIWLGLPGLVPVLLVGAAASMIVVLARRVAGPGVALLTVALWTSQAGQQRWRASYLSESTTALCWLLGWWCLLQWRGDRRSRWLLALAAITGLAAITRPMAALAFAIPVGVVVVGDCWRRRTWRPLVGALALGSATLGVIPVQNMAVLGDWRVSPLSLYTRQYMPFDRLGFGLDTTPADLGLTPQLDAAMASLRQRHADHVPSALPGVLVDRLRALGRSIFGGWRLVFIPAAMVGVVLLPTAGWLALATAATLLICYLPYAHEAHWSVYYVEAMPVAALVVALGAVAILRRLENRADGSRWGTTGLAVLALGMAAPEMLWSGRFKVAAQQPLQAFRAAASAVHGRDLLVFVRYADDFDGHQSFVHNVADIGRARVVTAHDLGPAINDRVRAAFPNRSTYRYDTGSQRLSEVESGQ